MIPIKRFYSQRITVVTMAATILILSSLNLKLMSNVSSDGRGRTNISINIDGVAVDSVLAAPSSTRSMTKQIISREGGDTEVQVNVYSSGRHVAAGGKEEKGDEDDSSSQNTVPPEKKVDTNRIVSSEKAVVADTNRIVAPEELAVADRIVPLEDFAVVNRVVSPEESTLVNRILPPGDLSVGNEIRAEPPRLRGVNNETQSVAPPPKRDLVIDVLSTGSKIRTDYIDAQRNTWASHVSVRNFYSSYQLEDEALLRGEAPSQEEPQHRDENSCLARVTAQQVRDHGVKCRTHLPDDSTVMTFWRNERPFGPAMEKKGDAAIPGWFCAQQRPGISLSRLSTLYQNSIAKENGGEKTLPDFLLLVDDDTYVNIELMNKYFARISNKINEGDPAVFAGCTFQRIHSFGYGGYGLMFNTEALERLIQPIYCNGISAAGDDSNSEGKTLMATEKAIANTFEELVCAQLELNLIGEKDYFRDGMRISDLMSAFSASESFCMHSDWLTAYFVKFYDISARPFMHKHSRIKKDDPVNRLHTYQNNRFPNCVTKFDKEACNGKLAHLCHQQTPTMMEALVRGWKNSMPHRFRVVE